MKRILLQTMPHTGTHTLMYLFSILGGIEVVWHHWEKNCADDIETAWGIDWDDFVFVRTYRNPVNTFKSYKTRAASPEAGEKYFTDCIEVYAQHAHRFPIPIAIAIDGPNAAKTHAAIEVFRRCEVDHVPPAAIDYMKSWNRIGSQHDKEAPIKEIKHALHKGRVGIWLTR